MEQMNSQDIGKLIEALSKAQACIEGAKEDSANPFFKSRYADLTSVWAACRKPLTENGLAVIQTIEPTAERMCLITMLAHSSGQWIKSVLPIPITKTDPQALGSAITYCRRYALSAIVGICPVDDDGEAAMKPVREEALKAKESAIKKVYEKPKASQLDALKREISLDMDASRLEEFIEHRSSLANKTADAIIKAASLNTEMMQLFKQAYSTWSQQAVNQ